MYAENILCNHIEKVEEVNLPKPVTASEDGKPKTLFSELEVRYTDHNINTLRLSAIIIMVIPDHDDAFFSFQNCSNVVYFPFYIHTYRRMTSSCGRKRNSGHQILEAARLRMTMAQLPAESK